MWKGQKISANNKFCPHHTSAERPLPLRWHAFLISGILLLERHLRDCYYLEYVFDVEDQFSGTCICAIAYPRTLVS